MNLEKDFNSPSHGRLDIKEMITAILDYMEQGPKKEHKLIIGSDSHPNNGHGGVDFVTAIIVHKIGSGGRYFWQRNTEKKEFTLRNRIYQETTLSFTLAQEFMAEFEKKMKERMKSGKISYEFEIHIDVGRNGETKDLIKEVVGMVRGLGFNAKIKPESFGASTVADRHT